MDNNSALNIQLGERGNVLVKSADSALHTGEFQAVQALEEVTVTVLTFERGDDWASETIPAGATIYGHFKSFQKSAGRAVLYNRE